MITAEGIQKLLWNIFYTLVADSRSHMRWIALWLILTFFIQVLENEIKIEEFCERVAIEDEVPMGISQETVFEEIYKNLKEIMMVEARKKAQYLKKSIRWLENTRFWWNLIVQLYYFSKIVLFTKCRERKNMFTFYFESIGLFHII